MIPQSFITDLLNRVDIVDVVGRYVQLKKGGANYMGLCPFHSEKSPSFTVSPTKQFYHCFGCGAHGTSIGFLIEYSGMGFVDAVKDLAQNVGMVVPEADDKIPPLQRAAQQAQSQSMTEALSAACDFYRAQLKTAPNAIAYLKNRGLTGEVAARFGMGYAPSGWDNLRTVFPDYDALALVESGLVIDKVDEDGSNKKRYDRFRERIMFPIRNTKGQVIGFGGRVLDSGEPKYLNSPETPLFQKGLELYGLFEARQAVRDAGYVLVTEGYMDVVALAQLGFPQAVATLGTACTSTHVQKLLRQTDNVIFSFDGDKAGRKAARRALEACLPQVSDNKTIRFLFLPQDHDPDSFVREFGADSFAQEINDAMPLSQFLLREVTRRARPVDAGRPRRDPVRRQAAAAIDDAILAAPANRARLGQPHGIVAGRDRIAVRIVQAGIGREKSAAAPGTSGTGRPRAADRAPAGRASGAVARPRRDGAASLRLFWRGRGGRLALPRWRGASPGRVRQLRGTVRAVERGRQRATTASSRKSLPSPNRTSTPTASSWSALCAKSRKTR